MSKKEKGEAEMSNENIDDLAILGKNILKFFLFALCGKLQTTLG